MVHMDSKVRQQINCRILNLSLLTFRFQQPLMKIRIFNHFFNLNSIRIKLQKSLLTIHTELVWKEFKEIWITIYLRAQPSGHLTRRLGLHQITGFWEHKKKIIYWNKFISRINICNQHQYPIWGKENKKILITYW